MTPPLSIAVPPSTSFLSPLRAMVTSWLGVQHLRADRWCLIITELVTNAMTVTDSASHVTIDLHDKGDDIELIVTDGGPGVTLRPIAEPDPNAVRGRGLLIVDALTSDLRAAKNDDGRTVIRCRRPRSDDRMSTEAPPSTSPDQRVDGSSVAQGR